MCIRDSMNSAEIKNLAINCYSCIKLNEKKINYMSFMQKMENKECNDAIKRKFKKVNINEIHFFIDGIECISDIRKKFYKEIISCLLYTSIKSFLLVSAKSPYSFFTSNSSIFCDTLISPS